MEKDVIAYGSGEVYHHGDRSYGIHKPEAGWPELRDITEEERIYLRPIAEVLALLDGNAFFGIIHEDEDGIDRDHWEQYLPEAKILCDSNGGISGATGAASFMKDYKEKNDDSTID